MVRLRPTTPGRVEVEMFAELPTIYLDHWALRKISDNADWRIRFLDSFSRRGTLLFSTANLAEVAGNHVASIAQIRSFLEQVGPHWMVISLNPFDVIQREAQWKPGEKSPRVGDFFFKQTDFLSRLNNGPVSLAHLIDMMDETQRETIVSSHMGMCESMVCSMKKLRDAYKKDPSILDRTFPDEEFSPRLATRFVCFQLIRRLVLDGFPLSSNHITDFFHTVVPVAHSDIVLLDKHWHAQVDKLKLPEGSVRLFKESNIDGFFDLLEAAPAVR